MRTIILLLCLTSCMSDPDPAPTAPIPAGWHEPTAHDAELVQRLNDYLGNSAQGPVGLGCSDSGDVCCSFSGGFFCCCSFSLGCTCGHSPP